MAAGDQTFLFADLAGFTALTEAHGDEQSADLAADFFSAMRELLAVHGGEEVKTIGDAVMVRATGGSGAAIRLGSGSCARSARSMASERPGGHAHAPRDRALG